MGRTFCTSILSFLLVSVVVGCGSKTSQTSSPSSQLQGLSTQITQLNQNLSCSSDSQCLGITYGYNACGGSAAYIVVSNQNPNLSQLEGLLSQYSTLDKQAQAGAAGPCIIIGRGCRRCVNSTCQEQDSGSSPETIPAQCDPALNLQAPP